MRTLLQAMMVLMLLTTAAGVAQARQPKAMPAAPETGDLDAALCQAQSRLEALRLALVPLDARKRQPVVDKDTLAAVLAALAEENLRIRDALYEVVDAPWPDEVKRAYVAYFLTPGATTGLAQRVGTENLNLLRPLLETPLLQESGWPTRAAFGPEADFHAFIVVAQGRGADPQWVAQVIVPRLKALAGRDEVQPLGHQWLAAGARADVGKFAQQFKDAGLPWSRYGLQLDGLAGLQARMPALDAAAELPPLTPAPCGAERPGRK
ncbi:hypothetical protein [Megalodesulfovibrio gigas]|nr:hypothetical protein [Megalodesulfovibrio gigas]